MPIDAPIHTNESNLPRVLGAGLPVVLVFWQRACPPCDQLNPALERLARAYAGRALIVKINAEEEPNVAARYNVQALPGFVFVSKGREVASAAGAAPESSLAAWLDHLTGRGPQPPLPSGPSVPLIAEPAHAGQAARAEAAGRTYGQPRPGSGAAGTATGPAGSVPIVLNDANFDQTIQSARVPVLVDFWAVWCGPCRMVAPVVEELAADYAGRALVAKVNVDENPDISQRYGIMSIPTLMIFRNGKMVDRIVGALPGPMLKQRFAAQVK